MSKEKKMAATNQRTKRLFISDIQMGDRESVKPTQGHAYGWLQPNRAQLLADFLAWVNTRKDVQQLIIIGDLFDEWVTPASLSPVPPPSSGEDQFMKSPKLPRMSLLSTTSKPLPKAEKSS